jgi:hypothetical protein
MLIIGAAPPQKVTNVPTTRTQSTCVAADPAAAAAAALITYLLLHVALTLYATRLAKMHAVFAAPAAATLALYWPD